MWYVIGNKLYKGVDHKQCLVLARGPSTEARTVGWLGLENKKAGGTSTRSRSLVQNTKGGVPILAGGLFGIYGVLVSTSLFRVNMPQRREMQDVERVCASAPEFFVWGPLLWVRSGTGKYLHWSEPSVRAAVQLVDYYNICFFVIWNEKRNTTDWVWPMQAFEDIHGQQS